MSTLYDTSRIPDDPRYWDALARRISTVAHPTSGLEWIGRSGRRALVAASVLAAAALAVVLGSPRTAMSADAWALAMTPRDDLGRMMDFGTRPPRLERLVLAARVRAREAR